tara:strand:- start:3151 stop:3483 length:333 start_codon:yes stop_codon:yes gene_type:complete
MVDTQELIDKINAGDMADAGRAFTELMGSKVQDALDDRKVELGNQMHLTPEELEELEAAELNDEDFEEDEDLDLEDEEDAGEDDQEPEEEGEEVEDEDDEDVQPDETESE